MKSACKLGMAMILFLCGTTYSIAEEPCNTCKQNDIELSNNYYLNSDQITFADQKIYVTIHDELYETPALFSDENGLYIQRIRSKCTGRCSWYEWECSCGFCNLYEIQCGNCRGLKAHVKCEK